MIHTPGGIRTRNPSKRAAAELCLRTRGHWDQSLNVALNRIKSNGATGLCNWSDNVGIYSAALDVGDYVDFVGVKCGSADERTGKAIQTIGTRRSKRGPVSDWAVYVVLYYSIVTLGLLKMIVGVLTTCHTQYN